MKKTFSYKQFHVEISINVKNWRVGLVFKKHLTGHGAEVGLTIGIDLFPIQIRMWKK